MRERIPMKPLKRKYPNGKVRWTARVWDNVQGRFFSLGTFDTKNEATQVMAEFYAKVRPKRYETCDNFAGRWVKQYPRDRESTNRHNHERTRKFAEDFKGVALSDVDRPAARAWALDNRSSLPAVRAMFNDALEDGYVLTNPFAKLNLPQSKGRKNIVALTEAEVFELADCSRVLLEPAAQTLRAMVVFSAFEGLRVGELCALRFADLGHDELTVSRAWTPTGGIGPTKNGLSRTIALLPQARDVVRGLPRRPGQEFVFINPRDGKHFTRTSLHYYWSQIRAVAGRERMAWHELRHACATILLARGMPAHVVAHHLGHTDGGILVQKLYGHPAEASSRAAILAAFDEQVAPLRSVQEGRKSA